MPRSKEPIPVDQLEPLPLTPAYLQKMWERELHSIGEHPAASVILHHVARAEGFAWALRVAELISDEQHRALCVVVKRAEHAALVPSAGGKS